MFVHVHRRFRAPSGQFFFLVDLGRISFFCPLMLFPAVCGKSLIGSFDSCVLTIDTSPHARTCLPSTCAASGRRPTSYLRRYEMVLFSQLSLQLLICPQPHLKFVESRWSLVPFCTGRVCSPRQSALRRYETGNFFRISYLVGN